MRWSLLFLACAVAPLLGAARAQDPRVIVGVSLPTQREERWVRDRRIMQEEAKRRGVDLRVQVTDNDAAKQLDQCENLMALGVKVLILAPHDSSGAAVIVDKAVKAGVIVISYDRLIRGSAADFFYLSFDNFKVGELQGEFLARRVPKGNYVVLAGSPTDNNARLFHAGAMSKIAPLVKRGDVKIVMEQWVKDWQPAEAQKLMEQALTASGNRVDAVLAPNDGTAGGVIQALAAQGLAGKIPVTGQDAEATGAIRIVQGTQSMTVFKDTRQLARKAIEMALDLAAGKPIATHGRTVSNGRREVPSVLLEPHVVTKENLDEVLIDSGYLDRALVHGRASR
ncbi:MAG TPA: substrate-binding domain-containing protein [Polyangiaceae bacterium]|nr:substrate-binding domain-containing protein [Polyangiaceae bacterium]